MTILIGELFDQLKGLTPERQVARLQKTLNDRPTLKTSLFLWLALAYYPNIEWNLPEGAPPYEPNKVPLGMHDLDLHMLSRKVYIFLKSVEPLKDIIALPKPPENLKSTVREANFIGALEDMPAVEAEFLLAVKDHNVQQQYGVTLQTVQQAFPNFPFPFTINESPKSVETQQPEQPPKRKRGRPRKNPLPSSPVPADPSVP